jgi:hypothetical protein
MEICDEYGRYSNWSIPVVAVVVQHPNEDYNGIQIISRVNTGASGRTNDSRSCVGLLCKLGYEHLFEAGRKYSDRVIARAMVNALKKEPVITDCEIEWRGSYVEKDARGDDKWKTRHWTMRAFPPDPDHTGAYQSSYLHTTERGNRVTVMCYEYVKRWGRSTNRRAQLRLAHRAGG